MNKRQYKKRYKKLNKKLNHWAAENIFNYFGVPSNLLIPASINNKICEEQYKIFMNSFRVV